MASLLIKNYEKRFPEALKCLENGLEDSLQFYELPEIYKRSHRPMLWKGSSGRFAGLALS